MRLDPHSVFVYLVKTRKAVQLAEHSPSSCFFRPSAFQRHGRRRGRVQNCSRDFFHTAIGSTPHRLRLTDSATFRTGTLEQKRTVLIQDLDEMVPEVEVEWFFENILPDPIEGFDVGAVVLELRKSGTITASGWEAFPNNPKDDPRHEDRVFSQLNSVFDAVIETTNSLYPGHTQQFSLVTLPNRPPSSERTSRTEPDANFLPTDIARDLSADEKKAPYSWYDIANPACGSRANPGPLVHFFVSIAFSSRTALGWDPTIEVCSSSSPRQYKITVNGQKFATVKNLADYSADSLISRATRVWLVKDKEGKEFVLKDVWMDTDRLPEHEIRDNLLRDVLKERGSDDHRTLSNHMLTPRVFERMKIDDMDDTTPRMMNEQTPTTSSVFDLAISMFAPPSARSFHPSDSTSQADRSETFKRTPVQTQTEAPPELTIRSKYHYRIVFEEHGTDLYSEMSLHNVFKTLSDLVTADGCTETLAAVMFTGSMTRSKVLLGESLATLKTDGRFRILFHAANNVESISQGTSEFMAYEAALQRVHYIDVRAALGKGHGFPKKAAFAHNPLHDLESVWWLLVYILLNRDDKGQAALDSEVRNSKADALFKTGPDSVSREAFMKDPETIDCETTGVASSFAPALQVAQSLALQLFVAYLDAEAQYTQIDLEKCMIHDQFRPLLTDETTLEAMKDIELTPVGRASVFPNSSGKRKEPPRDEHGVLEKREPKRSKELLNSPKG
ncbi:hypothetical protein D9757_003900 [Collybiopsis confluens]|uniref:Fungal-type protein kinase domain-containing protein n=1 Tax=Collybiopsis confluens TaxID=2823264 RepID=A0A8H5HUV7_9AGAR|nr:hypothetical protein D9757_003900 [Collybiopsis confluens]